MFNREEVFRYEKRIRNTFHITSYLGHARIHAMEFFPYRDRRIAETEAAAKCLETFDLAISQVNWPAGVEPL